MKIYEERTMKKAKICGKKHCRSYIRIDLEIFVKIMEFDVINAQIQRETKKI